MSYQAHVPTNVPGSSWLQLSKTHSLQRAYIFSNNIDEKRLNLIPVPSYRIQERRQIEQIQPCPNSPRKIHNKRTRSQNKAWKFRSDPHNKKKNHKKANGPIWEKDFLISFLFTLYMQKTRQRKKSEAPKSRPRPRAKGKRNSQFPLPPPVPHFSLFFVWAITRKTQYSRRYEFCVR